MGNNDSLEARLAALEARNEEQHKEVANKLEVAFELINKQTEIISAMRADLARGSGAIKMLFVVGAALGLVYTWIKMI
jgi:hypothetical protein